MHRRPNLSNIWTFVLSPWDFKGALLSLPNLIILLTIHSPNRPAQSPIPTTSLDHSHPSHQRTPAKSSSHCYVLIYWPLSRYRRVGHFLLSETVSKLGLPEHTLLWFFFAGVSSFSQPLKSERCGVQSWILYYHWFALSPRWPQWSLERKIPFVCTDTPIHTPMSYLSTES